MLPESLKAPPLVFSLEVKVSTHELGPYPTLSFTVEPSDFLAVLMQPINLLKREYETEQFAFLNTTGNHFLGSFSTQFRYL